MKLDNIKNLGWINNKWGPVDKLHVSICDRGLQMADGIFETVLILDKCPKLLEEHIRRWGESAEILDMDPPPSSKLIASLINEGLTHTSLTNGAIRLNWSRGDNLIRGINIPKNSEKKSKHLFWLELSSCQPSFQPISALISKHERRNANSRLSQCKTFAYNQAIHAKQEARKSGFDDALLLNTNDEICCGSASNLLVYRKRQWLTPRIISGCLPGIMRAEGLKQGIIKEAIINEKPENGDQWSLINSLSCHPIKSINYQDLDISEEPKKLWKRLLK